MTEPKTREGFDAWWYNIGSGITPEKGHDHEEHGHRIAKIAWETVHAKATLQLLGMDVFYHSPSGMVLAVQYGPVYMTSNAPPSPFAYVRLIDFLRVVAPNAALTGEEP